MTELEAMEKEFDKATNKAKYTTHFQAGVKTGWTKLNKYYKLTDKSPIYRMAIALHPGKRMEYFDIYWKKFPTWIKTADKDMKAYYNEYAELYHHTRSAEESFEPTTPPSETPTISKWHSFGIVASSNRPRKKQKIESEWERFNNEVITKEDEKVTDLIGWWWARHEAYPILSKLALDIFSIPAMSAEPERVFSSTKKLITDERNRLSDETVEADECQKHWLLSGVLDVKVE